MYKIKNLFFFVLYLLVNIRLLKLLIYKIYIPVFVQYEWLKNYDIKTIVNVGAYHGHVTHALHYLFPRASIHAFEPNKENCKIIAKRIRSEKLVINQVALSNKKGSAIFFEYDNRALSSLLPVNNKGKLGKSSLALNTRVPTTTLDEYFKNIKVNQHIFLKIDTQGTEGQILKGGREFLRKVSIIHMEVSFEEIYKGQDLFCEIYKFLTDIGFIYAGENRESYFYPNFFPENQINAIFINKGLISIKY